MEKAQVWWISLVLGTCINVLLLIWAWKKTRSYVLERDVPAWSQRYSRGMRLLAVPYVVECGWRSLFPARYNQRITFFDMPFNSAGVNRAFAFVGEICWAVQIAWALHILTQNVPLIPDAPGGRFFIRKVCPWLCLYIAVQGFLSNVASVAGMLTTSNLYNTLEELGWLLIFLVGFIIAVVTLFYSRDFGEPEKLSVVEVLWRLKEGKSLALDLESHIKQVQAVLERLTEGKRRRTKLHSAEVVRKGMTTEKNNPSRETEVERMRKLFGAVMDSIKSGRKDGRALYKKQLTAWRQSNLKHRNVVSIKQGLQTLRALLHQQHRKMFGIPNIFETETPPDVFMMRFFLKGMVVFGLIYVPYMALIDVPKYYSRYQQELKSDFTPTPVYQGLVDSFLVRFPTQDWRAWEDEWTWMSIYFNLGCWSAIMLMLAPGRLTHIYSKL